MPRTSSAIVTIEPNTIARIEETTGWKRGQIQTLKEQIAPKATDEELQLFAQVCATTRLSPFKRQIYAIHRWDKHQNKEVMSIQTGIDGYRSIAQRTGLYAGTDVVLYNEGLTAYQCLTAGVTQPVYAVCTVKKLVQGQICSFTADVLWEEFYPGDKLGFMWKNKPFLMLGKTVEAQALRKAFPDELGDVEFGATEPSPEPEPPLSMDYKTSPKWMSFVKAMSEAQSHDRIEELINGAYTLIKRGTFPQHARSAIEREEQVAKERLDSLLAGMDAVIDASVVSNDIGDEF